MSHKTVCQLTEAYIGKVAVAEEKLPLLIERLRNVGVDLLEADNQD